MEHAINHSLGFEIYLIWLFHAIFCLLLNKNFTSVYSKNKDTIFKSEM